MTIRRIVGCMTGTSIDGIDAALVEIDGTGLAMKPRFIRGVSADLGSIREPLRRLANQHPMTAAEIAAAMRDFSLLHAKVVRQLLNGEKCDLVAVHGQTVFHKPPLSWQLMQPAPIARELGIPVVFDMRAMDLAAGGQGAPITPIADWILFRSIADPMAVVNLGGFSNYTAWFTDLSPHESPHQPWADPPDIRGGDLCVCNQLLDSLVRDRVGVPMDEDGRLAAGGVSDPAALSDLCTLLSSQGHARRSLGTGDELSAWSRQYVHLSTPAILRTACEAIAQTIIEGIKPEFPILVAGGGAFNRTLLGALAARSHFSVATTQAAGVPVAFREAACFAVLGSLCQDRIPITLPQVTGVSFPAPVSGAWVFP